MHLHSTNHQMISAWKLVIVKDEKRRIMHACNFDENTTYDTRLIGCNEYSKFNSAYLNFSSSDTHTHKSVQS